MAIILASPEMSLALDNDVFSQWRSKHPYVLKAIAGYQSVHKLLPVLTSTTVFETLSGIEAEAAKLTTNHEATRQYRIRAELLIQNCIVLPFDQNAAAVAAYIFPRIPRKIINKLWRDVFITATALAHRHGIATGNKKDFEFISNHLPPSHPVLRLTIWKP